MALSASKLITVDIDHHIIQSSFEKLFESVPRVRLNSVPHLKWMSKGSVLLNTLIHLGFISPLKSATTTVAEVYCLLKTSIS